MEWWMWLLLFVFVIGPIVSLILFIATVGWLKSKVDDAEDEDEV